MTKMKIAILLKQVPDSQSVRIDSVTGTLVRDASDAVTNPLDLNALTAAVRLAEENSNSEITVISMGPPSAERTIRESLALGADRGILISDRHAAGSDTLVTASILAAAIRKFGPFDLILTGVRASDGETGQVGPEIASNLGITLVTGADTLTQKTPPTLFESKRTLETGTEQIQFNLPALVAVTKAIGPPDLPTLDRKKWARREAITAVTAADLGLSESEIGLNASPTRVVKIGHPTLTRHGNLITVTDSNSLNKAVNELITFFKSADDAASGNLSESSNSFSSFPSPSAGTPQKKIAFYAESAENGDLSPTAFELLTRALRLASPQEITAILITRSAADEPLRRLAEAGTGRITVFESDRLTPADLETRTRVLAAWCAETDPDILLGAANVLGRALFPCTAMKMKTGLTADCTSLSIDPETGLLLQTRPAIGGNVTATIKTPNSRPQMATVRPHSAPAALPLPYKIQTIIERRPISGMLFAPAPPVRISFEGFSQTEDLANAKKIVSIGKGIKRAQNIEQVRKLADQLGASLGATRETVDRGWLPPSAQIGLSGRTVSPEHYLALGISGAVQHLAGIRTAKKIAAVNNDPDAPIFRIADLGIVGDLFEIIPELLLRLTKTEK